MASPPHAAATPPVEPAVPLPQVQLVETDGEPLETPWHFAQISLLIAVLTHWWRDRTDFYVGGNMFIYYSEEQARNRDYRGPDFFYVDGVNRLPVRPYWAVWLEGGRYPDLIVELLSPTTAREDRTTKKALYERTFRTHEYFCFDPATQRLEGWRLGARGRYQAIQPDERGWLWSEELDLWLGTARGTYLGMEDVWLRCFDAEGRPTPTPEEAALQRLEEAQAEVARLRQRLAEENGQEGGDPPAP